MQLNIDSRYFHLIFNSISHGIFTINEQGKITSFNHAAESISGYSAEEAIGKNCYEIFRADICRSSCPLKHSVETRENFEDREVVALNKDGMEIRLEITTAPLINDDGKVVGGVEMFRDLSQLIELKKKLKGSYVFEDIVSKNNRMQKIIKKLPLFASSNSNVIIGGASGTGKELIARALHNLSHRKDKPFIVINCAAIPDNLLESELFGYVKGAFTDAKKDRLGRFAIADGGSLFLDEIAEISPQIQAKLLRVIQEKQFEPLGSDKATQVDIRIIAASNKILSDEVQKGNFREDLFYRLNVINIDLPPLSQRQEDIPLLVEHFINRFNLLQGRKIKSISTQALTTLMAAPLNGNIRELENAIEYAFVTCRDSVIDSSHLPPAFHQYLPHKTGSKGNENSFEIAEFNVIQNTLLKHNGNRSKTAEELGISRNTLWRKMKRLNIT